MSLYERIEQLLADGLGTLTFERLLVLVCIFLVVPIVVRFYIEREKIARAKEGAPKISRRILWISSGTACAAASLFIMVIVAEWPMDLSWPYAVISAVTSPVVIWIVHQWLKSRNPTAAEEFGEDPIDETVVVSRPGDES